MYTYKEYLENRKVYQESGVQLLVEKKHACLFYKAGKGKTYPTVEALQEVWMKKGPDIKVLILSTADSVKNMWNTDIVPQNILPENTVILSFNSAIIEERAKDLLRVKWDVIIVDECHKAKSHNSKTSKLLYKLCKNAEYVWGLSGTPRANSDVDIYCQFHNMWISDWGYISYTRFVEECCNINQMYLRGQCVKVPIGINDKYRLGFEKNVARYSQRVDYDETDNMPDLNVTTVKLPYVQSKEYKNALEGVIMIPDYETTMTKLVAIMKLQQICNGYLYTPVGIMRIANNSKCDWLRENLTKEPTVIVYRFEADYQDICLTLDDMNVSHTENVDDFKNGQSNVLLLECARCESFNLQMCKRMIFYTMDYSYVKYDQMIHRIWRMGQTEDVKITVLVHDNSEEVHIWDVVQNKETAADLFMRTKGTM